MPPRTLITRLGVALGAALLAPAAPATAALPQQLAAADVGTGTPNPLVHGGGTGEQAGTSVASIGDLNGDGLGDMVVGAPLADANSRSDSGSAYIAFGRDPLASRTDLAGLGATGVRIDGGAAGDRLGGWVAPAGDVDGDGRADLIVGAALADPNGRSSAGAAYVITGAWRTGSIDVSNLGDKGWRIDGPVAGDRAGSWVAGGGDEDDDDLFGDGGDDQMFGGAHQDELRGGDGGDTILGEDGQDFLDGEDGGDLLLGGAGFDHLTGDAGDDRLLGESGSDILDGGDGTDSLDGGAGDDRLFGGAGDDVVSGGDGKDLIEESAGKDRIAAGAGNDEVALRRGGGATVDAGAGNDKVVAFSGRRDTIVCGAGRDTAYVDRIDRVKGCEKRVFDKPRPAASKRKKRRK